MRYRNSFFNPTVFRSCLRRFWPLPLTVFGVEALALVLPLLRNLGWSGSDRAMLVVDGVCRTAFWMILLLAASSMLSAALMFRHIHSRKDIQFYHALPVKRRCLYGTGYLTGYLMIAVPMLLGIVIAIAAAGLGGVKEAAVPLLELYGAGLAALTMFYSMAVVACCLAGQTLGAVLICGGMHGAVMTIAVCAGNLAALFMPGISTQTFLEGPREWLTPVIRLLSAVELNYYFDKPNEPFSRMYVQGFTDAMPKILLIYAAVGVLLAVGGAVLYQIRRAENAGEMVAFSPVRTLCKLFGALVVCAVGADVTLTYGLFSENIPFWAVAAVVLVFGVLGWFIAEMVVRKSLRVFDKKALRSCGVFAAVLLILLGIGKLDLFGTVRYVPELEQVQSARIWYGRGAYNVEMDPADAAALHQTVLENRQELTNNPGYGDDFSLQITYDMGGGQSLCRSYAPSSEGVIYQTLADLMKQPEYVYQSWLGDGEHLLDPDMFFECQYNSSSGESRGFSYELAQQLHEAIFRDIEEGRVEPQGFGDWADVRTVSFYQKAPDGSVLSVGMIPVTASMTHTLAWLRDAGISLPQSG